MSRSILWPVNERRYVAKWSAILITCINIVETGIAMRTTIKKWGNSLAIRIPQELADEIGLEVGSEVELRVVNGELLIKRRRRKRYDRDELLASVPDDFEPEEWDTGPPVGKEVW